MRVASVVGTRPQLIKAAALQPTLRAHHDELFIDTGQHWDDEMAGSFFRELGLARPDHSLATGGGTHAQQTAAMLLGLEPILDAARPDAVLVYGDTNSTLAGALVAAKLRIPVAHVEAGLRSFDRRMPEELNRVVVDHLSQWLFAPTTEAVANLRAEGIDEGTVLVGDLMKDLAAATLPFVRDEAVLGNQSQTFGPGVHLRSGRYLYATIHRAENREPPALTAWSELLAHVALPQRPVVLALHPGTRAAMHEHGIAPGPNVILAGPQTYRGSLALQLHAAAVLTDSGGVQRESAWLGVPCLVLRDRTEWHEAVAASGGRLSVVGLDASLAAAELERLAPIDGAARSAAERAAHAEIQPTGAAEAMVAALDRD